MSSPNLVAIYPLVGETFNSKPSTLQEEETSFYVGHAPYV